MRSLREAIADRLLTLYLIRETTKRARMTGKVKLLKMVYRAQEEMKNRKLKGFNYRFYKWKYGPLSKGALQDYDWLIENELIKAHDSQIELTPRGLRILEDSKELLNKNRHILDLVDKVVREYLTFTGKIAKKEIYDRFIPGTKKRIEEATRGQLLLGAITQEEARHSFLIDDDWAETLHILMNKESFTSLEEAEKDAREGRVRHYEPVA